jgi:hypothetical protein
MAWAIVLVVCGGGIAQERSSPGLAAAEAARYRRNLSDCLFGLSFCNRQLLAPDDLAKIFA